METIKNYLESMFASLPDTPEVRKAKDELWQMMEDKYNELIEEGESENAAIGTVIAEFGNLDELADDLGLRKEVDQDQQEQEENPRRVLSLDEVKDFLKSTADNANRIALGVFFCIICPIGPIIPVAFGNAKPDNVSYVPMAMRIGVVALFVMLGFAIACFITAGVKESQWSYLRKERCMLDMATANFVAEEKARYRNQNTMKLTLGIILCALCWLPSVVMAGGQIGRANFSVLSAAILLILVGLGVYLLIQNGRMKSGYIRLLRLNDRSTMAGQYVDDDFVEYKTEKAATIMRLYWPTVTALYLCVSFVTFRWDSTWIIWPIAGILYGVLKREWRK